MKHDWHNERSRDVGVPPHKSHGVALSLQVLAGLVPAECGLSAAIAHAKCKYMFRSL